LFDRTSVSQEDPHQGFHSLASSLFHIDKYQGIPMFFPAFPHQYLYEKTKIKQGKPMENAEIKR